MAELIYIGHGFLPGVPARDLTAVEVELHGGEETLIKTGLYRRPLQQQAPAKPAARKRGKR